MKQALIDKFEEVKDLYSRGLLTIMYISAWEDVMKIVDNFPDNENIHLLAHKHKTLVRFWPTPDGGWACSARPMIKGIDAVVMNGNSYWDCEHKIRQLIESHKLEEIKRHE